MGRIDKLYGYNMGQYIDEALIEMSLAEDDVLNTIKSHPVNPAAWVQCMGRTLVHIKAASKALRNAKKIYDSNKGNPNENNT